MRERSRPESPVPILIEVVVGRDRDAADVLRLAEGWERPGLRVERAYTPVEIRGGRENQRRLEALGVRVFVVRALADAAQSEALARERMEVRRVVRDVELEPHRDPGGPFPPPRPPTPGPPGPPVPPGPGPQWPPRPRKEKPPVPPWPPAVTRRPPPPPVDCGAGATGTLAQVQTRQGVDQLWALGFRGTGIVVGMVDGGIDTAVIGNVVAGWPADWGSVVGWNQHAHMTATAVLGMAPDARLWDLRIWQAETGNPATDFAAFLGNALQAYRFAIDSFEAVGIPQILSNSWGLWNSANGIDYATNPASQIAQMVEEALDAGMLVVFSAGNCGAGCTPPARCGANDTGSSKSILGPNGHPRVITVGAANNRDHWCGYTSQGPAVLPPHAAKPDFCGIAQYRGYNAPRPDAGTSAAAAIVSGVIALMKQKRPGLTQDEARTALASTARDIRAAGFDMDSGAGVIRAKAAFDSLP